MSTEMLGNGDMQLLRLLVQRMRQLQQGYIANRVD